MALTASTAEDEKEPFLTGDSGVTDGHGSESRKAKGGLRNRLLQTHGISLFIQLALLFLNVTIFFQDRAPTACLGGTESDGSNWTISPAEPAVQYTVQDVDYEHRYTGEPRLELDRAWSQLLRSSMIRLSEEEMRKMNKTSVALRDGSGYVGYIEAIHMLHCVKRIYQAQYPEHYSKLQQDKDAFSMHHWNHCLEAWADERTLSANDMDAFLETLVLMSQAGSMGRVGSQ
ncbi:hypothetical protein MFIFM68171_08727 [Madurella fahalii]|uniref:Uncharacterized protein n=1 Tax=Madurella fahalii TaxID=1157608 RepID=A0ABQ0GL66_9PEZI